MFQMFLGISFMFIVGSLLSALFDGNSFAASTLSADMGSGANIDTIGLVSASGYADPDGVGTELVVIENEVFAYSDIELTDDATCSPFSAPCLTGVVREQNNTDARQHPSGEVVYSHALGTINMLTTFDVAKNTINVGIFNTPIPSLTAFGSAFMPLILFDYAYLDSIPILRFFLMAIGVAFVGAIIFAIFVVAQGLFG